MTMSGKVLHEENSRTILTVFEQDALQAKKFPQYLAAILATFAAFAAGTCLSWSSPALPLLYNANSTITITPNQGSWIGSIVTLGAMVGAIPAGMIAHWCGRKRTLQMMAFPLIISWYIIAYCDHIFYLYLSRFLAGISIGAISVAAPMYVSELAEPRVRGALGTLFQLQITLGILFEYVAGMIEDFRMLALISAVVPILFLIAFSFVPESPVHLKRIGDNKGARRALQWFRGAEYDIEDEITRMSDQIEESERNEASINDLFKSKATFKALIISLGLMVFQQLSGVNAVLFYTSQIFIGAGSTLSPTLCSIIVGFVQVVATYISSLLVDRAGRRLLLIISDSIMSVCLATLSVYFYLKSDYDLINYSWVPLMSVALFIIVFSLGFGPIPWLMMGEIFPAHVKGPASSIAASFNWLLAFTVTKVFQDMMDLLGTGSTFVCFTMVCVLGTLFVYLMVPETKGKDIDEIQAELAGEPYSTMILSVEKGTKVIMTIGD